MSIDTVRAFLAANGVADRILEYDTSTATVAEAAAAIGCKEQEIAKTMAFEVEDHAVLVVLAGDVRIDNSKFKSTFHKKATMLKGDNVERLTGHPAGGVCPFCVPEETKVYLDASLKRFETVYPACGSRNSGIPLSIPELEKLSRCEGWVDVSRTCV